MTQLEQIHNFMHSPAYSMLSESSKYEMRSQERNLILSELKSLAEQYMTYLAKDVKEPIRIKMTLEPTGKADVKYDNDEELTPSNVSEPEVFEHRDEILTHPLDWSPFEYGFTIDHKYHENIFAAFGGIIPKGKSVPVIVEFEGEEFKATIGNADVKGRKDNIIRLLYSGKKQSIGIKLKERFPDIYSFIKKQKEEQGGRKQVKLPDNLKATIRLFAKDNQNNFKMECK